MLQDNTIIYDEQIEYDGNAYLDLKQMPSESFSDLDDISRSQVFNGMDATVLSDKTVDNDVTYYRFNEEENKWVESVPIAEIIVNPIYENCVTFTSVANNSHVGINRKSSHQTFEYSLDKRLWDPFNTNITVTLSSGESVYIRGILTEDNTLDDYTQFAINGAVKASGNINMLWNHETPNAPLKEYCGKQLFYQCKLVSAPELPSTTLSRGCYYGLFWDCDLLTTAPDLPATAITPYCYYALCWNCTSLTKVPDILPAMVLEEYCYAFMFGKCTRLASAPELPATTLAESCYNEMFTWCNSLTVAPELPATTLAVSCYKWMLYGTGLITAPELPATALAEDCYFCMFGETKTLTAAPKLSATVLVPYCYQRMFENCTSLNYINCLATDISETECTENWTKGVAATGVFVKNANMTSWTTGIHGIPSGWEVVNDETE